MRPVATFRRLQRVSSFVDRRGVVWGAYQRGQVTERCKSHGSIQAGWNLWPQGRGRNSTSLLKSPVQIEQLCGLSVCSDEQPLALFRPLALSRNLFTGIKSRASGVRHRVLSGVSGIVRRGRKRVTPLVPSIIGVSSTSINTRIAKMMATLGGLSGLWRCSLMALATTPWGG